MNTQQTIHCALKNIGTNNVMAAIRSLLAAPLMAMGAVLLVLSPPIALAEQPVNINLASAEVLAEALDGVGLAKAYRIIEYREAHGPFEHVDELAAVQGIGEATVEKIVTLFDCSSRARGHDPCF